MKTKKDRLKEFHKNMSNDSLIPSNAEEANTFLRRHLDAVEESSLPSEQLQNYTYRMMIPSFNIEGAWSINGTMRSWKAFGHIIEIHDCGSINICTNEGVQWLSLGSAA
ncbi:hypothetical protein MTF66_02595 [Pseudoalteromonas sp. 2CM39R]|uniref:hypothetical protein n=1 Tax=Pseudoalteromonas sp. 2CM39R TaxID=2929856 RepID=UPI0020BF377F|nr:hypothetical protein [Pseudoalteromonas sp. 2CM39R]MCK8123871.1 hypothetical protein [Pseudoalteromonas sp. 2CM39R]